MTDLMPLIDSWGLGAVKKLIKVMLFLFFIFTFWVNLTLIEFYIVNLILHINTSHMVQK